MAKSSLKNKHFSTDEDSLLIKCVSEFDVLWRMNHPDFKNNMKKETIWNVIGPKLNKTGESCKRRWKSIRDHFMRERKDVTGKAAKRQKRATYWGDLSFLHNTEDERQEFPNKEVEEIENVVEQKSVVKGKEEESYETHCNIEVELSERDPAIMKSGDKLRLEGDVDALEVTKSLTSTPDSSSKMQPKRNNAIKKDKTNKRFHFFEQNLVAHKSKMWGQGVNRDKETFVQREKPQNENVLFFKSMAAIIHKFDQRTQAIARKKVFAVISDLELSQLSDPSTSKSYDQVGRHGSWSPSSVDDTSSSN